MPELRTTDSESSSLPTPSASQEPGWTIDPVDKDGNPVSNPNERWYNPITGRHMQKGITQVLKYAIDESSLLRSPIASQGEGGALGEEEARKRGNTVGIRDQAMDIAKLNGHDVSRAERNLMPTPTSRDHKDGSAEHERNGKVQQDTVARAIFNSGEVLLGTPRTSSANGSSLNQVEAGAPKARLEDQVQLFPTLRASDGYERRNQKTMDKIAREGGDMTMPTLARTETNWGRFEPAIARWERILGRPAPFPTKPDGKDGAHRLSSAFTEWMMGLPEGWITDVGLSRNEELKACGNGVVPQQAELALRMLLEGISAPRGSEIPMLPTATPSDAYIGDLKSVQRKPGSMHSVNLAVAVDGIQKGEM